MIRVSVLYPNEPGARFDHQYYATKHVQLLNERCFRHQVMLLAKGEHIERIDCAR